MTYLPIAKIESILPYFRREIFENNKNFIVIPTDLTKVAFIQPFDGGND